MTESGQSALPPIHANLLGEARIRVGMRTIPEDAWPRRNARSLLLLLLMTPGHRLPRDRVIDLLWPEVAPERAINALYVALHGLRRVLEPDLGAGRTSAYIESSAESIGFRAGAMVLVDVEAFDAGLALAESAPRDQRRMRLRQALALYGGELLPTDPYEDWPVARREALHRAWEGAVLDLAALDLAAGESQAAVAPLEKLIATDSTHEEAHRALMRAYAAAGQRDRALRQYARCQSALEEELGTGPDEETEALYAAIRAAAPESPATHGVVSARFNNLPAPPTPTVGREREREIIQGLLWRQDVRLVTLTGPGGIGKTRLALDVAISLVEDFAHGVVFVPLATVRDPALVLPAIARTLDVGEEPNQPLAATLQAHLRERELLLVLDNVEQVLEAAVEIGALLAACASLTVLVTSRERLRLRGEHVHEVPPLTVPHPERLPAPATLGRYGAIALFRQHLRLVRPDFDITPQNSAMVTAICRHLEGLPLAIELATARARFLTLQDLLDGLVNRLDLLQDGPRDLPARQRTLRDTIAWSYDLLIPEEQVVFRRLAVFTGGCARAAAETVCAASEGPTLAKSRLHSLAEKHLVRWEETDDEPRLTMLETVREFAAERLQESGEEPELCRRHAVHYLTLAERAEPGFVGPDQITWIDRLEAEQGNLRSALGWALDRPGQLDGLAARAAAALWRYWWFRGRLSEGISWLDRAASLPGLEPSARAHVLLAMAELVETKSDYARAAALFSEALALSQGAGDRAGAAQALCGLGQIAQDEGNYDQAVAWHQEALSLYREVGNRREEAGVLSNLASVAYYRTNIDTATALWEEALQIVQELGDRRAAGLTLGNLGAAAVTRGDFDQAVELHQRSLAVARQMNDLGWIAHQLSNVGEVMYLRGEGDPLGLLEEALVLLRQIEDKQAEASALTYMGNCLWDRGEKPRAASHYAESLRLCQSTGDRTTIANIALLERVAAVARAGEQPSLAARLLGSAESLREALGAPLMPFLQPVYEQILDQVRSELSDTDFMTAWTSGREMALPAAISAALSVCQGASGSLPACIPAYGAAGGDHPSADA
ncbi:MAG TPA: tetratricopeptide repeat protein [Thermomicrobiales bacterium]|nr:tetratricopeptide repeat protein [Thermomicrobiales bacterium]